MLDEQVGNRQDHGDNPIEARDTAVYQKEFVQSFVEKWDELIDLSLIHI